jgi:hypothetical protein
MEYRSWEEVILCIGIAISWAVWMLCMIKYLSSK